MKPKVKIPLSDISTNPINFITKRLPNFDEALIASTSQATFDTFSGRVNLLFGGNPTSSAIFRDASKLPSIYANVLEKNSLGYTDIKYDEGHLWSHGIKVACKASILIPYALYNTVYYNSYSKELSSANFVWLARSSNYICEIPNRYLSIATIMKQNSKNTKSFLQFIVEDSETEWWKEATGEALVKTAFSDQLGEVVKHVGYINSIRDGATLIDNYVAISLGGNAIFEEKDDIYSKAFKSFSMFGLDYRTPIIFGLTSIIDWTAKFSTGMINTYILGTPIRTCQDFTGVVIKEISNSTITELIDSLGQLKHDPDEL